MCPSEPASPQDNPPPQLLAALLLGKKFLEVGVAMQAGKFDVGGDFLARGEALIEGHAEVLESAIDIAGTRATRRHVIVHGSAFLEGRWILDGGTIVIGKDLRIDGESLLISLPTFVVLVFHQQIGAEVLENQGGLWSDFL